MESGARGREREGEEKGGGEGERKEEEEARKRRRGRGKEQERQQLGLTEAAGGSSMPCAELGNWEVEWTAAVRNGPCTRVFPAHSLSRALCARNRFGHRK